MTWWPKDWIPWHHMPLLSEGETVKLSVPKNIYSDHIVISTDVDRFPTSKSPMKHTSTEALAIQVMVERQTWWLPDGKTMSFVIMKINFHHVYYIYICIIFIKIMVACGSVSISLTSLYKYYGTVLVTCDSMWDLLIFRATVTSQF